MGLFSNKKKLCPICGNFTPRFFPTEIEGQPICKECKEKIELPVGGLDKMTLDDFRKYLADFETNSVLLSSFNETYRFTFGLTGTLLLDENNGFIRFNDFGRWVIEKKYIKSFCIFEDNKPLFESGSGVLNIYDSDIPERVNELVPMINRFNIDMAEYRRRTEREDARMRGKETDDERRERQRINEAYRPRFDVLNLFDGFRVEITTGHPYWPFYSSTISAPTFSSNNPNADSYMRQYEEDAKKLYELAIRLMRMINPDAVINRANERVESAVDSADVVTEIRRFKELLEQGIITEREFEAKKRQLMGI